ncbi:hypothetical protein Pelo_9254 [Pelomyxa schiedti]|nr:hypothetical protein Pelo_9254 [Pelomyxa schiedti]
MTTRRSGVAIMGCLLAVALFVERGCSFPVDIDSALTVTLTWDNEDADLDLHVVAGNSNEDWPCHIYFWDMESDIISSPGDESGMSSSEGATVTLSGDCEENCNTVGEVMTFSSPIQCNLYELWANIYTDTLTPGPAWADTGAYVTVSSDSTNYSWAVPLYPSELAEDPSLSWWKIGNLTVGSTTEFLFSDMGSGDGLFINTAFPNNPNVPSECGTVYCSDSPHYYPTLFTAIFMTLSLLLL